MTHEPDKTNSQGLFFTVLIGAIATLAFGIAAIALYRYAMNEVEASKWIHYEPEVNLIQGEQAADRGDIHEAMSAVLKEHQSKKE